MAEKMQFQAEVSKLLDLVANALYSKQEVFLRELISNASDACDSLRYKALTNKALAKDLSDPKIQLVMDTDARTLTISDNGIGMDKEDLVNNLGTIAHSGTSKLMEQLSQSKQEDKMNLIGQFGVGFYSVFIVSDKVEVKTRKAGDKKAWVWSSDGKGEFEIDEVLKENVGTEITLYLKDEASEFLLEERLKNIVQTYSDHVSIPVYLGEVTEESEPLNSGSALWMRPKSEITEEQYTQFFDAHAGMGVATGMNKPWLTVHWKAEGTFEYTNLLYIPGMKPFDLYDPARLHGVKLYVKRVFITEGVDSLIPPFLRFVKGVVDSEDLPLNISREVLQNNPLVAKMGVAITKRILEELRKKAENEPEAFEAFWSLFGAVVKEGLYDAHQHRESLNKVVRFYSSKVKGLTSFEDYIGRMKEGQKHIYYSSGGTLETLKNSPQLEGFNEKDVEVLFMTDTIDDYWVPIANDIQGKTFHSITKSSSDLSDIKGNKKADKKKKPAPKVEEFEAVIERLKAELSGEVKDVCLSERLTESPVCLVAPDTGMDMHMERMLKQNQGYEDLSKRILEINAKHPVIEKLQSLVANDENVKKEASSEPDLIRDTAFLLLDQARIIEGDPLPNPRNFARRMSRLMEQGLLSLKG